MPGKRGGGKRDAGVHAARDAAVDALVRQCGARSGMGAVDVETGGLDERDARLAEAIYRTAMERWITVHQVIDWCARGKRREPGLDAILVAGAAQLLFMDRIPDHAVVDTAVEQAKKRLRKGAGALVNAVLRKVGERVVERKDEGGWSMEAGEDTVPWQGGLVRLDRGDQAWRDMDHFLSFATSHPVRLVKAWRERWGDETGVAMLCHGLKRPAAVVRLGEGDVAEGEMLEKHERGGYAVWKGGHEQLVEWLSGGEGRWVQDSTAGRAVEATRGVKAELIVDYCAGRGTKTRQLLMTHPEAQVVATDVDEGRLGDLREAMKGCARVTVVEMADVRQYAGQADLLLLDVPCSNTGVLARRLEARYRYRVKELQSLASLQKRIVEEAGGLLKQGGVMVYSTCSVERMENEVQAAWAAKKLGSRVMKEEMTLPGGEGCTYRDGGYWAMVG